MRFKRVLWILSVLLLIAAAVSGYFAWVDMRQTVVVVEWKTASELETVGFNLYRSESPDGPFEKINASLIPASPDPLIGGEHTFEDTDTVPNTIYYYQLEDVQASGASTRYGPIEVKAVSSSGIQIALSGLLALVGIFAMFVLRS